MEARDENMVQFIRSTRADPPGLAADDPQRRAIYGAALQQFEQLLRAARAVDASARPLPLFYALSQATRAIAATRSEVPKIGGHGLSEYRYRSVNVEPAPDDLLQRKIRRHADDRRETKREGDAPSEDAFGALLRATGSGDFDVAEVGALWASLPEATVMPESSWLDSWRPGVQVSVAPAPPRTEHLLPPGAQFVSIQGHPRIGICDGLTSDRYPALDGNLKIHEVRPEDLRGSVWGGVSVDQGAYVFAKTAPPVHRFTDRRALIPTLPGQAQPLSHLATWWALLFSLSIFARYHPELWVKSLDVDGSQLAVPLETMLDLAIEQVPTLIYGELYPAGYPPTNEL